MDAFRLRDIVISLTLMLLFSWLFLLIFLVLWVSQEHVFFVQERTGWKQRPFRLVKFSTLRDIRPGEREEDAQRGRLTAAGKWLRRFSLDELPQLWNVLRGDMSLVGPRPLLHEYLPLYSPKQLKRFEVRPGITGWAQVKGRNALTWEERFALDAEYVRSRSFIGDLRILFLTPGKILSGRGVYAGARDTMPKFRGSAQEREHSA